MKRYCVGIITVIMGFCLTGQASLIAQYTFDSATTITNDSSGNGKGLEVYPGYGTPGYSDQGVSGGASSFNGSTQGWIINNYIYPAGSFTFAAWIKPEGTVTMISTPWSLTTGYNVYAAAGAYRFMTYYDSSLNSYKISSAGPILGEWQHIAMTFEANGAPDGTGTYTGTIKGYLNGELIATLTGAQYDRATSNDMAIGRRSTSVFTGLMDEINIYDNALTQSDIQALMTIPEPASFGLLGFGTLAILLVRRITC